MNKFLHRFIKVPSTLIRFQTKTELFCSGYGYRPHYNAQNDHWKRSHSKTLSRVERIESDAFWKCCFLVWTEKTMLSENGDVIKNRHDRAPDHSTVSNGGQTLPCGFNFAPISLADILKCACVELIWVCAHTEGIKAFSKRIRRCSVDGRKRYENDAKTISVNANLFENGAKQLRFRLKTD